MRESYRVRPRQSPGPRVMRVVEVRENHRLAAQLEVQLQAQLQAKRKADMQTPKSESSTTSQTPRAGDRITIKTQMWLSINEATHKESLKCATAKDEIGLEQMEAQGRIFVVPAGTTGRAIACSTVAKR